MSKEKVFDIDEYLVDSGVEIKINGKLFSLNDIPYEAQELMQKAEKGSQKAALKLILGCEDEDLEKYGIVAISKIVKHITDSLFPEPSQKDQ